MRSAIGRCMPPRFPRADDAGCRPLPHRSRKRPLFMLCAPEPIEVIAEIPRVRPTGFAGGVCCMSGPRTRARTHQPGMVALGRQHNSLTRDYFRVEDRNGCRLLDLS
ncbi:MAG: hypothetical protein CM15mP21_2290 [Hyphomicrobiales bacterium]|nr:MAG: hypothetical protein CM15mP21_2290 [Hyphomicrobiales bacterium]